MTYNTPPDGPVARLATPPSPAAMLTTQWTLVLAAGERSNPSADEALDALCRAYWPPLYAYVRRRVASEHEALDLTQAFFERLLEKNYLAAADPQRGRFRSFLLTAFQHFLCSEWEKARAQKRGGGRVRFSIDLSAETSDWAAPTDDMTAERAYDHHWAITLLNRVMERLQREQERAGKAEQFMRLKHLLVSRRHKGYRLAAAELGVSEPALRMAASRMRRRYRELLRDEIARTVASPDDIDDELKQLFAVLSR